MPNKKKTRGCCLLFLCKNKVSINNDEESTRPPSRITWAGSAISMTSLYNRARYRLPIDERDIVTLTQSWERIEESIEKAGVLMFMEMFQQSPHVREVFQKFIGLGSNVDLATSTVFQTHGLIVMNAVNDIITGMDDKDDIIQQILYQGRNHATFQNMKAEFFWAMENPFMSAIKSTLSGEMSTSLEKLYKKLIRFVLEVLVAGFQQAKKEEQVKKEERQKLKKSRTSSAGMVSVKITNNSDENQNRPNVSLGESQNRLNIPRVES